MKKQQQEQKPAATMFEYEDLPLFSGTTQQVEDSPFAPQSAPQPELEQLPLFPLTEAPQTR